MVGWLVDWLVSIENKEWQSLPPRHTGAGWVLVLSGCVGGSGFDARPDSSESEHGRFFDSRLEFLLSKKLFNYFETLAWWLKKASRMMPLWVKFFQSLK